VNADQKLCAQRCLDGAERDKRTFPEIIADLTDAGFESYAIDFRRASAVYYLPSGDSLFLSTHGGEPAVADRFDADALQAAIREAQTMAPGYTYKGFCEKAKAAGCAGYLVSFSGGRVLYFGRSAETHVELFPQAQGPVLAC
jgi:uncharacterized protein YbcV (DUF1398 family)